MARILNILLLLIALVGVFFAWQARTRYEATRREHARLTAKVGRLPIEDATKVHVLALPSDDPLDFKWQVYVPAGFDAKWSLEYPGGGNSSSGVNHKTRTGLARVQFRKVDGQWYMWRKSTHGSSIVNVQYGELLEQPQLLTFQQLGKNSAKVLEADEIVTLLKITSEQKPLPNDGQSSLLKLRFGSRKAWASQQAQGM